MKILVIGEVSEDIYWYGQCKRLNPEAPTPVLSFERETRNPGMAGNTAENIKALRPTWKINLVRQKETIIKRRLVDEKSHYILLRVDQNDHCLPLETFPKINGYDAVIISDYDKGFLSTKQLENILVKAFELGIPTFIDTKKILGEWSNRSFVVKINEKEFLRQNRDFRSHCQNLIVTKGGAGADLITDYVGINIPSETKVKVTDVSGAGDTFLAALVIKFLEEKDLLLAVKYANKVAAIAVSKPGVATVAESEI